MCVCVCMCVHFSHCLSVNPPQMLLPLISPPSLFHSPTSIKLRMDAGSTFFFVHRGMNEPGVWSCEKKRNGLSLLQFFFRSLPYVKNVVQLK